MLCSKGFDKHIISCVHHRSITLKNFTAVKIPWLHLFIPSPFPITPGNPFISTISLALLFQKVMQLESYRRYVAFSDWCISLSNMYLRLHHTFLQRRQWHPTPALLPGKSHGRRSLVGCSPWGREESNTTEWLHFHFSLSCIGEGNGTPLQCSCMENPRDRGAWRAL